MADVELDPGDLDEVVRVREKAKRDGDNRTLAKIWERELDELHSASPDAVTAEQLRDRRRREDEEFRNACAGYVADLLHGQGFRRVRIDCESDDDGIEEKYVVCAFDKEHRRYDLELMSSSGPRLGITYDRDCMIRVASSIAAELYAARRNYLRRMGVA